MLLQKNCDIGIKTYVNRKSKVKSNKSLPIRPDHGYLHTLEKNKDYYGGFTFIGRLNGLAKLNGLELGLVNSKN